MKQIASPHAVNICWADQTVQMLAARALYWPAERTLFIADPHFGKQVAFHAMGIPIPSNITGSDLNRLSQLLNTTGAERLIVLGDFYHTRHSQAQPILDSLVAWRRLHSELEVILVGGNHDSYSGPPPADLNIVQATEPFPLFSFHCLHHPISKSAKLTEAIVPPYYLAGHIHPVVRLHDTDGSQVRLPCFVVSPVQIILPAFGAFTGGKLVAPRLKDRIFVIAGDGIFEATPKPATHSAR
jgi:uncharacterized protein